MTTSLAILPSAPVSSSPAFQISSPTAGRRPKLSLNTASASQTRSFGKGASLRLETLSAVSPTIRNTFSNAYEAPAPAQGRPSLKLNTLNDNSVASQDSNKSSTPRHDSATASSASSTESLTTPPPYKLSHHIPSILSNSPYPQIRPRKMATRPFFPSVKRVSFKEPLVEEITNKVYTAKHSDLESSVSSMVSGSSETSGAKALTESDAATKTSTIISSVLATRAPPSTPPLQSNDSTSSPTIPSKRDSSDDSESEDSCPETPIAGRRKRNRDWRWTIKSTSPSTSTTSSVETSASDSESS